MCSGETQFPRAQEEGPAALAIRPSPRPSPPRRAPAPYTRTPNPSTRSGSRGPNFLHLLAAATTLRTPKQLNSRCRAPVCVSSPPAGSPDTAPSRPEPPSLLGFPTARPRRPPTTQRPSQPSHAVGSTVRQGSTGTRRRRRLRNSGAGGARAGRGRKARSLECGGSQRLGARPAPPRRPRPRQPAAELSSAHSGRRECSTAERAMKETAAQVEARAAVLQSRELGHTHLCLFLTPARILEDSLRASEHD